MKTAMKDFNITFGANYLPIENRNTADAEFCSTFKTTTKSNNMDERNDYNSTYEQSNNIKKILTLVRGLPGSGKSTFANLITNEFSICEADKFFTDKEGNYNFDAAKLPQAHKWCREQVEIRMKDNQINEQFYPEIAVSNTFTQEWEMQPYLDLAKQYGYVVFTVVVENRHGGTNQHGVPADKLEQMRDRFEIQL